jgi:hypothetical protein
LYRSWWTVAALATAFTLRHHIPGSAVNTLEGYLHPRSLAFAVGVVAVGGLLRHRPRTALALAVAAVLLHPLTGLWFITWIGVALFLSEPALRRWWPYATLVAVTGVAVLLQLGAWRDRLVRMDQEWLAVISVKDYLFPGTYSLSTWGIHALYVVTVWTLYRVRRAANVVTRQETGLAASGLVLALLSVTAIPLVQYPVALAVQLQVSRVFSVLDLLATVYVVWFLVEARLPAAGARRPVFVALALTAVLRGAYVTFVEHSGRPVVAVNPQRNEWQDVMSWAREQPLNVHLLVDPGHGWRYGTNARLASERDVYLDDVKDAGLAVFSRDAAMRILQRTRDLGAFSDLTPAKAQALASKYDLHFLITEQPMSLPLVYRNAAFLVYRLKAD